MGVVRQLVRRPLDPVRADVMEHGRRAGHHRGTALIRGRPWRSGTAREVFGRGAERRAREALGRIHRQHRTPVLIETIKSLDGAWIADVARRRARMARAEQLYILVAGSERDVGVIAARHGPASRLTDQQRETIRRAFLGPLQAGEADGALEQGVRAIGTTLDSAAASEAESHRPGCPDLRYHPRGGPGGPVRLPGMGMVRGQEQATS